MEYYSAIKRNKIVAFADTWMDPKTVAQSVLAVWETQIRSLGQEDPLEKENATPSSTLAQKNSMDGGASWATVHVITKTWT